MSTTEAAPGVEATAVATEIATGSTAITVADLLAAADRIAPTLQASARASEQAGRLDPVAAEALTGEGFFRLWMPPELGGPGATIAEGISVIERVAEIDTSAAWNLAVCAIGAGLTGAYLADHAVDTIFADGPCGVAGQTAPIGTARPVDGGLEVNGRWMFGSGIHVAGWVKAGVRIVEADVKPRSVLVVMPVDAVTIVDGSWDVAGLAGSGSYDYTAENVFVPEGYWFDFPLAPPLRGGSVYKLPLPAQVVILHAGFALGAARRSMSEVSELAKVKVRQFDDKPVAHRQMFRHELAEHHARLSAARLYVYDCAARLEAAADDIGAALVVMREIRAAARYATDVAIDVATWAYRNGGGAALKLDHPLQRYLRDLLAAAQHIFVDDLAYADQGAMLLEADQ